MRFPTKLAAGLAAVTILAAGAFTTAGTASAQEPTATPQAHQPGAKQQRRENFLNHIAQNLGVTLEQVKAAIKDAELQVIDGLVQDGTLTSAQGQAAKDKINSGQGIGIGKILGARRVQAGVRLATIRAGIVKSAADAIGVAPKDLVKELQGGKSIADVAGEHSVPLDTVKARITSDAKTKLDKAVADGKIDQAKADDLLQKLTSKLDDMLNKKGHAGGAGKGKSGPAQQG